MKKQTYIAIFKDNNGIMVTFERFSYARIETVKNNLRFLLGNSLYRVCVKPSEYIDIYKTEYEWRDIEPVYTMNI